LVGDVDWSNLLIIRVFRSERCRICRDEPVRVLAGMLLRPGLMRPGSDHLLPYAVKKYAINCDFKADEYVQWGRLKWPVRRLIPFATRECERSYCGLAADQRHQSPRVLVLISGSRFGASTCVPRCPQRASTC